MVRRAFKLCFRGTLKSHQIDFCGLKAREFWIRKGGTFRSPGRTCLGVALAKTEDLVYGIALKTDPLLESGFLYFFQFCQELRLWRLFYR